MPQPTPPSAPTPGGEMQVRIGTSGVQVIRPGDGDAIAALQAQAQLLKARIEGLRGEIEAVKSELSSPGAGPMVATNQVRLTQLESRRTDAEEALQRVEDRLAAIGVQPTTATVGTPPPFEPVIPFDPNQTALQDKIAIIAVAAIVFIGAPIAVAVARLIWKRTTARSLPAPSPDDARRLERLEQAVDSIAIEVERMSEGQRYVTKLLAERAGPAPAEPIGQREAVPLPRR